MAHVTGRLTDLEIDLSQKSADFRRSLPPAPVGGELPNCAEFARFEV